MTTRILLLQEIEEDRKAIADALSDLGYEVIPSPTVAESLEILERESSGIDVVLVALHLAEESSFDLLRAMKSRKPLSKIPFIFCCLRPSQFTKTTADSVEIAAKVLGAEDLIIQDDLNPKAIDERIRWALTAKRGAKAKVTVTQEGFDGTPAIELPAEAI